MDSCIFQEEKNRLKQKLKKNYTYHHIKKLRKAFKMMQVEAVIGSLSSTMRKTGLMSPFSSSTGSAGNHGTSNKKGQRHSAIQLPTNGTSSSDGVDGSGTNKKGNNPTNKIIIKQLKCYTDNEHKM